MAEELDKLAGPDGGKEGQELASYWNDQISAHRDDTEIKRWIKRGEKVEKRYRDDRGSSDGDGQRRYSALWANVEILKPALYGKMPLPVAERRFKDRDPAGRGAAQILERALRNEIEINGFDEAMQQAVSDYLLPGRGVVWVRYEPEIEDSVSLPLETQTDMVNQRGEVIGLGDNAETLTPAGRPRVRLQNEEGEEGEEAPEVTPDDEESTGSPQDEGSENEEDEEDEKLYSTGDRIIRESTPVDFVPWPDFLTFPVRARVWREVTAVAKRVYMSRGQLINRFGKEIGKAIPLRKDERGDRSISTTMHLPDEDKAQIYEIWSKEDTTVYWVAEGYRYLCDRKDDPLELENFFPVPRPLYANPTNNTLVPVPDYIQYQDQAIQIDELTQRLAMLTKGCKWAGLYNAAAKDVQRLFNEAVENQLIPVDDWAAFAEKGGVEGNMSLLPVKDYMGIINELTQVKAQQIQEMDRLTGITDVMRGTTDARETLGGQRLKSNSTGTRLTRRQNEVARFARDTVRIMADIMANHFSPQSLIEVSGALYEEGLGPDDMPPLSMLQSSSSGPPPQGGKPPGPPGAPPDAAAPTPPHPAPAGGPSQMAPESPPQEPGSNVVPFKPPQPPQGMPPGGPQMPMGALPPPIPPELLAKLTAIQRIAKAIQLLRDEKTRGFRIDIEVDSTIFADQAQEKDDRNAFILATTQFLEKSMLLGSQMPEAIPLLGKLLQFGVRGHRVGRDLEVAIEEFTDQAIVTARQKIKDAENQPNPEQQKLQMETLKIKSQIDQQKQQTEIDKSKAQVDMQAAQAQAEADKQSSQAEIVRQGLENQGEQQNSQAEMVMKQMEVQMKQMEIEMEKLRMQVEVIKSHNETQVAMMPPPPPAPKAAAAAPKPALEGF